MKIQSPISYRLDINGLRAYAVLAVLLFHFKIAGFGAGFLGVDIFFVISGFLMTAIVSKGLEKQNFGLFKFYMARVRRIVPVLIVLIAVLLGLGWFWLPTPDYKTLGAQSAYALSFISNIHYWRAAGYFDAAAHEKWLLHTWTLGVEFQFYILLPLYLLILNKIKAGTRTLFYGLLVAVLGSLALSIVASSWKPVPAFYLLPTRGWEFGMGGLVFLAAKEFPQLKRFAKAFFVTGFALLAVAMLIINSDTTWPSGWALLPTLATALIILSQQEQSILTAHPIAQWLGDRSYSIYLWHWPIVVALYFIGIQDQALWIGVGILLSLLFGHLSFWLVETPTRQGLVKLTMPKQIFALASVALVVGLAAVSARLFVFEGRLPQAVEVAAAEANNKDPREDTCSKEEVTSPSCIYGEGNVAALFMGDSHAMSTVTAAGEAAKLHGKGIISWAMSSCHLLDGMKKIDKEEQICEKRNIWVNKEMQKYPNMPIILASRITAYVFGPNEYDRADEVPTASVYFTEKYSDRFEPKLIDEYKNAMLSTYCRVAKERPVYVMRPIPEVKLNVPNTLARDLIFHRKNSDIKISLDEYQERHKFVWDIQDQAAAECGVKILNPLPYLCDDQYCYGSKNGRPLYYDDDHLSEYGNKFLVPMFEEVFKDMN